MQVTVTVTVIIIIIITIINSRNEVYEKCCVLYIASAFLLN